MRLLIVKLSSLGDVIQALPVLADILRFRPGCEVHWAVEEAYADLLRLHPGVGRVIPVALRRWRRQGWLSRDSRREFGALRRVMREGRYDLVVDLQGLLKSVLIGRLAATRVVGLGRKTVRDPSAALFYHHRVALPPLPAQVRCRLLMAHALGYTKADGFDPRAGNPGDFGLALAAQRRDQVVLAHVSARDDKLWPEADWIELGRRLAGQGLAVLLPWGSDSEHRRAERLAAAIPGARVLPGMGLVELAGLFAACRGLFGLDTGLSYLAIAAAVPTVRIYCGVDTGGTAEFEWDNSRSAGQPGRAPTVEQVWQVWQSFPGL